MQVFSKLGFFVLGPKGHHCLMLALGKHSLRRVSYSLGMVLSSLVCAVVIRGSSLPLSFCFLPVAQVLFVADILSPQEFLAGTTLVFLSFSSHTVIDSLSCLSVCFCSTLTCGASVWTSLLDWNNYHAGSLESVIYCFCCLLSN